jgi:protoporphyrinogen oxidase
LYQALVEAIRRRSGVVTFDAKVTGIHRDSARLRVRIGEKHESVDRVVATMPLHALAELAPDLPEDFVRRYTPARGLSARCIILTLERSLSKAYWINVCDHDFPFMVAVEHTNMIAPERYGGRHIVYLGNYGTHFPRVPVETLVQDFAPYLRRINPDFSLSWVTDAWQFVAPDAQPIVPTGYRERIAPNQTPVPGLFLANLYQVYPHDRGQNYAVEMAETLVRSLASG